MPSLTITYTAQEGTRIAAAVGREMDYRDNGSPRDATAAEVKAWIIQRLRVMVRDNERAQAQAAIQIAPFDPT